MPFFITNSAKVIEVEEEVQYSFPSKENTLCEDHYSEEDKQQTGLCSRPYTWMQKDADSTDPEDAAFAQRSSSPIPLSDTELDPETRCSTPLQDTVFKRTKSPMKIQVVKVTRVTKHRGSRKRTKKRARRQSRIQS